MQEHKKLLDDYVSRDYDKIMSNLTHYCKKTYPILNRADLKDLFNQSYLDCSTVLLQAKEDYKVRNIGDYFYASLRHKAIKMSIEATRAKNKEVSFLPSDNSYLTLDDIEDTYSKDLESALIKEEIAIEDEKLYKSIMEFVLANHSKDEVDAFKFRTLSNLTYKEMGTYSGISESGIRKRYLKVHRNILNNFKETDVYEILKRFERGDTLISR
jgi:RNA polymerase sigma factor (sigma-70 family)